MSKAKATPPDTTVITLEMENHSTFDEQRRPVRRVTVTARKGAVGYVGEAQVADIEADLLPILGQVQSVFFQAEVDGLPAWPDMSQPDPAPDATTAEPDAAPHDGTDEPPTFDQDAAAPGEEPADQPLTDQAVEEGQAYTLSFYGSPAPDTAPGDEADPGQPALF